MTDAPEQISVTITTGPATCEWVEYIRADLAQPVPEEVLEAIDELHAIAWQHGAHDECEIYRKWSNSLTEAKNE